jgi:predicted RNase H-like HicB family nuclease
MQSPYTETVKTYTFKVVIEPDEGGYHAYCPALRRFGAITQGSTQEEALKNIDEVIHMIINEFQEDGIELSTVLDKDTEVFDGARIAITV